MKTQGLHTHRFMDNPEERRFAKAWELHGLNGRNLDYLLQPAAMHGSAYVETASDRDRVAAAALIQWLGSPVGQGFLRDLGYVRSEK